MRQLAKQQQGSGVGSGATADAPWRLNIEEQSDQMNRDWQRKQGGGGGAPGAPAPEMDGGDFIICRKAMYICAGGCADFVDGWRPKALESPQPSDCPCSGVCGFHE